MYDRKATGKSEYGGFIRGEEITYDGKQTMSSKRNLDCYYAEGLGLNPHYVDVHYDQEVRGKKMFYDLNIDRFGELSITDNGKLSIKGEEIRPRAVNRDMTNEQIIGNLIRTGIFKDK
jgi:hypothetical protein